MQKACRSKEDLKETDLRHLKFKKFLCVCFRPGLLPAFGVEAASSPTGRCAVLLPALPERVFGRSEHTPADSYPLGTFLAQIISWQGIARAVLLPMDSAGTILLFLEVFMYYSLQCWTSSNPKIYTD